MTKLSRSPRTALCLAAFALSACGSQTPDAEPGASATASASDEAEAFAARIKGASPRAAANATEAPRIAQPLPGAATGPYAPGTATDPQARTCNAPAMGPYIGRPADDAVRAEIMQVIGGSNEVRFIQVGSGFIKPDATSARLNLMLDAQNIIRDARCG